MHRRAGRRNFVFVILVDNTGSDSIHFARNVPRTGFGEVWMLQTQSKRDMDLKEASLCDVDRLTGLLIRVEFLHSFSHWWSDVGDMLADSG